MKFYFTLLFNIVLGCSFTACGLCSQCNSGLTVYYVDSVLGDDQYEGTSPQKPWKSLARAQQATLKPGTQILFKRGQSFTGVIDVTGEGTANSPICLGAFGEGEERPILTAPESCLYTVRVLNSRYVTIQDLEIVNQGTTNLASRTGVKVESTNYGVSKGIRLNNLFIRDVNGVITKWDGGGSGILIVNGGNGVISTFDSLTIENCHIKNCQRNAMIWSGYSDRSNWHPSTNVWVHHNLIEEVPGDGIVPIGCDGAIIEYNVMHRGVSKMLVSGKEAAAGFWPWASDNTIIRYNEVSDHKGTWDGQAFDADYNCVNTVIEYNYSHGNDGGLALLCSSGDDDSTSWCIGTESPVLRYNISIGDGNRNYKTRGKWFSPIIHIAGPVRNALISRNILHNKVKEAPYVDRAMIVSDDWAGYATNTTIKENIFYTPEDSYFDFGKSTNNSFEGNYYLGNYSGKPVDAGRCLLQEELVKLVSDSGESGLLQLMDSVMVAGGVQCKYVSKKKIEAFFNNIR